MSTFVLVHGAWHGAWCWEKVAPLLEKAGHKVIANDLPCHGDDKALLKKASLELYTQSVISTIYEQNEPVVLIGHSMGGMIITSVAEQIPNRISKLIYLTAYVPINMSFCRMAMQDKHSSIKYSLKLKGFNIDIEKESAKELFYHDCANDDVSRVKERLGLEPILPLLKKVRVTRDRFGSVEKMYIKTTEDKALSPQMQDRICKSTAFSRIIEMKTSHSPFYSSPIELSEKFITTM